MVTSTLVIVQNFSVHVVHFFDNVYKNTMLSEKYRRILVSQRPDKRRGRCHSMNVKMLQVLDTSGQGITVKKPTTCLGDAELGLLASQTTGKEEMYGYYYGALLHINLANV